jgi:hypothetical protein
LRDRLHARRPTLAVVLARPSLAKTWAFRGHLVWAFSGHLCETGDVRPSDARTAKAAALAVELRGLLRAGLPVRAEQCGPGLRGLRGLRARALHPDDPGSQARALDALLREQLDRLENAELAGAVRLLFGTESSTSGATLTDRRVAAAKAAGYEVHHFRKRIEPKLVELVAWQLQRDSEEFSTRHAEPPQLSAASGRMVLPADVFAWEAAEHQTSLARLWAAVYGLRAELLTVARMISMTSEEQEVAAATASALWRQALVLAAAGHYRAAYGDMLLHAASDLGPAAVAAFAGWTPALTPGQERTLIECTRLDEGLTDFTTRLNAVDGGPELAAMWRVAVTGRTAPRLSAPEGQVP